MKKIALFLILAAGMMWGCMGLFVRHLNAFGFGTMDIILLRLFAPLVIFLIYLPLFNRRALKIRLRDIWCFIGTGICSITFFNFCYFNAITMTDLSIAAVLLYTAPAFVMILSYFLFREKFTRRKVLALILTFFGCVLVTGIGNSLITGALPNLSPLGILFGIGSGFGYALYSIFSRYALQRGYSSLTITFYTFVFSAVSCLFLTNPAEIVNRAVAAPAAWPWLLGIGVVCTFIPYLTYTVGLNFVENSKAAIIVSIEPAMATALGVFVYHEQLDLLGYLGIALVLLGIVICNLKLALKNEP